MRRCAKAIIFGSSMCLSAAKLTYWYYANMLRGNVYEAKSPIIARYIITIKAFGLVFRFCLCLSNLGELSMKQTHTPIAAIGQN